MLESYICAMRNLYGFLDSHKKLEIRCHCLENFKCSIFFQPTFKELTISSIISMDSFVYIMQQFFLSPYPVTLRLNEVTISGPLPHRLRIPSLQSHPTQHSKILELLYSYCVYKVLLEYLPSTVHFKKFTLISDNTYFESATSENFSKMQSFTVDECTIFLCNFNLNDLFHITTAKEWNITIDLSRDTTKEQFIFALTNIKGVVTKLCIHAFS